MHVVHVCVPFTLIVYLHLLLSVCVAKRYWPARWYSQLENEIHDPRSVHSSLSSDPGTAGTDAPGGSDDNDDGPGSSEDPTTTDSPSIGELGGSNSGEVLGCSLLPLLAAALLSAASLWF